MPQITDSNRHPPVNLTLVLDRSDSMSVHKPQKAKQAAIAALHRLSEPDPSHPETIETVHDISDRYTG